MGRFTILFFLVFNVCWLSASDVKVLSDIEIEVFLGPPYGKKYVIPKSWASFACKVYNGQTSIFENGGDAPDPDELVDIELSPGNDVMFPIAFVPFINELWKSKISSIGNVLDMYAPTEPPVKDFHKKTKKISNDAKTLIIDVGNQKMVIPKNWAAFIGTIWAANQVDQAGNYVHVSEQQKLIEIPLSPSEKLKIPRSWVPFMASVWSVKDIFIKTGYGGKVSTTTQKITAQYNN